MEILVKIPKKIQTELIEIRKKSPYEECGIFLGILNEMEIKIDNIIQDKINAFKTFYSTIRTTKNIYNNYINLLRNNESSDYIGEWHTHPHGSAKPSFEDEKAMAFLIDHPKYGNPKELLLGIIGTKDGLIIYLFTSICKKLKKLNLKLI